MSKIGKQPITIPKDVTITINNLDVDVKGPKGELKKTFLPTVTFTLQDDVINVIPIENKPEHMAIWGLSHVLLVNMIEGVSKGFEKNLDFEGVGYRAQVKGDILELNMGYSHPVEIKAPNGISFEADKTSITIRGIDKQLVGELAARIRKVRPPEPYKGKGIRYRGEKINRKVGKKAATAG